MKENLKLILQFAKPHKGKFVILFLCIFATTFLGSTFPYLFGRIIDEVFYEKNMDQFLGIVLLYSGIYLVNQLIHFGLNMSWAKLMTRFLFDIRRAIFNKVLSMKGKDLSGLYSGDVISRMGPDTVEVMNFIHWNVFYALGGLLSLLLSIGFLIYINWILAVVAIVLTPLLFYFSSIYAKRLRVISQKIKQKSGFLSSWFFEIIRGIEDIKILCAGKNVLNDFTRRMIKITRLQIRGSKVEVVSERVNSGISLFALLIIYSISSILVINQQLQIGEFIAAIGYFGICVGSFKSLNGKINNIAGNMTSVDRIRHLLLKESEETNEQTKRMQIKNGKIKFENVSFRYHEETDILTDINMTINEGEIISLVGYSGAGKTTLANLLYKLYEVKSGRILIDDINVNDFNLHDLREQIGIVHQDSFIYEGTIRYNLIFRDDKSNDEELNDALKKAHLYEFVHHLPLQLDEKLTANHQTLSGGQKQRLAVARIFIKNPKLLIFDEATSSLDMEAETVIKETWNELCKGRTIIVIAHRLSTIINSDKIAVLEDGQIKGFDKHDVLIKSNPFYQKLFEVLYFLMKEEHDEEQ